MRVTKKVMFFIILLGVFIISSCSKTNIQGQDGSSSNSISGEGPSITRTLSVPNLTGINLETSIDVIVKQGVTQEIIVTGQSNIIDNISTEINNNIWRIFFIKGVHGNSNPVSIEIIVPNINYIKTSSSGNIVVKDFINQNSLSVRTSSSGDITLNKFEGITELDPTIESSGSIDALKDIISLQKLDVKISSMGNFNGFPISSNNCIVNVSSSGNAHVMATDSLNVTISSSGSIYYKGNPIITQSISSSGTLINAN